MLRKFGWDFFPGKRRERGGKEAANTRNAIFDTQTQKVQVGLYPGKQATNAKKDAFNA